jgi:type III secretory pathway component EscS
MGGMIELVQAYCTGGRRSGEWLDLIADIIGVAVAAVVGSIICILRARCRAKDNKD